MRATLHRAGAALCVAALLSGCQGGSGTTKTNSHTSLPSSSPSSSPSSNPSDSPSDSQVEASDPAGRIVFSDFPLTSGLKRLYIEHADGSHRRLLVRDTADDVTPTLSPDGRQVIFSRERDHGASPDQIWVVGVNGHGLHQIVPDGCPAADRCGDAVEGHAYSPSGTRIVFSRAVFLPHHDAPAYVELWTAALDGSQAFRLTRESGRAQDDDPSWAPDGRRIVYLHWVYGSPDQFRIATIGVDGRGMRLVTPSGLDAADPSYSPDGAVILFQSPPDPVPSRDQLLYTVRPDGSRLTPLVPDLTGVAANHPSWSPNGQQIVFCHVPSGSHHGADLYVVDRDGSNLHPLAITTLNENGSYWGSAPQ